jgi:thiol peroxidase
LEIEIDNKKVVLQKKDRALESEAPAMRVKMDDGETKVIGMMADKVQVFISMPNEDSLTDTLKNVLEKHNKKSLIYIISANPITKKVENIDTSSDFKNYSLKMGVNVDDTRCAKSIFIINKDGEIIYKEIVPNLTDEFNLVEFDESLDKTIKFKKKGHTHENWMGV